MGTRRSAAIVAGLTGLVLSAGTPAVAAPDDAATATADTATATADTVTATADTATATADTATATARTAYQNPISADVADTFADPVIVRGQDGWWYAYGTTDPLREGERTMHRIPIARSADLTDWTYVGDAFAPDQRPSYATATAGFWAPDVRYVGGRWVMYMTVTDTTVSDDTFDTAIGVATAPSPAGPWTFADEPVVAPRPSPGGGYLWTIDPAHITAADGRDHLYFGSYNGGISVTELSDDGLRATGDATLVAIDNKFEGAHVIRRDGWYYLFASSANCCAGPATGYSVSVGRSRDPRGPFVDRDGVRLDVSRAGGTPVVAQNGNRWIGVGHNGWLTDLSGQDWLVYHGIDRSDPYLDEPFGINERPMLLDRLDWIDGWPTVRAGAGPSEGPTAAPVTTGAVADGFADPGLAGWRVRDGGWRVVGTGDGGRLAGTGTLASRAKAPKDVRLTADVRLTGAGTAGVGIADRSGRPISVSVDATARTLTATAGRGPNRVTESAPLPATVDPTEWHRLAVEIRGKRLTAELTPAGLGDQVAALALPLPVPAGGPVLVTAAGAPAEVDNVTAAALYRPVTRAVPTPTVGARLRAYSDEFVGTAPAAGWTWVRPDPAVTVRDGALNWPVQGTDLVGTGNTASVLLRDAPTGDYVVETKVRLDLGTDTVRNYQQAGLVAYVDDDRFARLSHVAIWNTRQVEYGYEVPFADGLAYGGNIVGPPDTTTWLRLAHRVDPATGEHEFRAGSSPDGRTWTWGGVWTFPADTTPRIGLVAHGGAEPPVTAAFDYFRVHRGR
ncbi:family 43 glycosylhydrolase [Plantactinospora sp. GCM10030261]|uniref:family 43 glycosylhydrolase n=1 Tax=Plantactinospora sp. GCM10030261 TaxID=3273420 RepID=UPI0036138A45